MRINHNIQALNAYRQLMQNQNVTSKHLEKLSSGLRINRAADDAAGLAISEKMRSQIRGLKMAERNCMDGISLIQTAEGALNEVHAILQRMRELATQAANGTYTPEDRNEIQGEINQLTSEINRIANTTEFNTNKLLKGGIEIETSGDTLEGGTEAIVHNATANEDSLGDAGTPANGDITFTDIPTEGATITIADKVIGFYDSTGGNYANETEAKKGLLADYVVDINGLADGAAIPAAVITAVGGTTGITGYTLTDATSGKLDIDADAAGEFNGTTFLAVGADELAQAAAGTITFTNIPSEGNTITISNKTIGFYNSNLHNYSDDADAIAGLGVDYVIDMASITTIKEVGDALTALDMSGDPPVPAVTLTDDDRGVVTVTADTAGIDGNTIGISAGDATSGNLELDLQIGANTGQGFTIEIDDIRAAALKISSKSGGEVTSIDGMTTAMYTRVKAITRGTDNVPVEYALDVSTHDNASSVITILDDAMSIVSTRRSKLGAYQNRLEHTINNLNAATENLTAAESRIRDADMALEMTEFTKNNIINQAATAMLAQANQLPQGILKLLQ